LAGPRLWFIEKRRGGGELKLQPAQCSSGVMNAAGLLLELFASGDSLAIMEAPEGMLHKDAVPAIRESFVAASKLRQVLVTSHDTALQDDPIIPSGCVHRVEQTGQGTNILRTAAAALADSGKHRDAQP
jgi:predicted ATPase